MLTLIYTVRLLYRRSRHEFPICCIGTAWTNHRLLIFTGWRPAWRSMAGVSGKINNRLAIVTTRFICGATGVVAVMISLSVIPAGPGPDRSGRTYSVAVPDRLPVHFRLDNAHHLWQIPDGSTSSSTAITIFAYTGRRVLNRRGPPRGQNRRSVFWSR